MAKLNRESKLRDKRAEKQARKAARKMTAGTDPSEAAFAPDEFDATLDGPAAHISEDEDPDPEAAVSAATGGVV